MRRRPTTLTEQEVDAARLARWAAFLITIAAIAVLGLARSAQAAVLAQEPGPAAPLTGEELGGEDNESEDEEAEGCEEEEEEGEQESGECVAAVSGEEAAPPTECRLQSTRATVSVIPRRNQVRLVLRYTTLSPAQASIAYALRGNRGALKMGEDSKRFSRKGVFRDTETLSDAEMPKVKAATEFDIRVHAVNSPRYCHRLFDQALTVRRAAHGAVSWTV